MCRLPGEFPVLDVTAAWVRHGTLSPDSPVGAIKGGQWVGTW